MSKSRDKVNYFTLPGNINNSTFELNILILTDELRPTLILRCHTKYKDIRFSRFYGIWMQTSHPTKKKQRLHT